MFPIIPFVQEIALSRAIQVHCVTTSSIACNRRVIAQHSIMTIQTLSGCSACDPSVLLRSFGSCKHEDVVKRCLSIRFTLDNANELELHVTDKSASQITCSTSKRVAVNHLF